jgi:hypothetical protein
MSTSKRGPAKESVSINLSKEEIARVDALIACCSSRWHKGTRSDVMRALLIQELERAERGELCFDSEPPSDKEKDST